MLEDKIIELSIDSIAAGGEGIGRLDGKTVFVRLTVPGDKVRCQIISDHKTWARADLLELLEASQDRISPKCQYYEKCGGCDFQHIEYQAQIRIKTALLKECMLKIGNIVPPEPEIHYSAPWEYRNRVQFHCIRQFQQAGQLDSSAQVNEKTSIGFKMRKSSNIVPVTDCPVADPGIRTFLKNTEQALSLLKKDRFTVYSHKNLFLLEGGKEQGTVNILGREINLDVSVFFQSNAEMLEKLIIKLREIANLADIGKPMADLYCGAGTFAAFLMKNFSGIDLMENNKAALDLAKHNILTKESSKSVKFFCISDSQWPAMDHKNYSFIVADPPRQGLAPALCNWIGKKGPPLFAYVSCNPVTLARDSKNLYQAGYKLSSLSFLDFYPQTSHIESLAVFKR